MFRTLTITYTWKNCLIKSLLYNKGLNISYNLLNSVLKATSRKAAWEHFLPTVKLKKPKQNHLYAFSISLAINIACIRCETELSEPLLVMSDTWFMNFVCSITKLKVFCLRFFFQEHQFQRWFLNLSTNHTLDQIILCYRGCPVHTKILSCVGKLLTTRDQQCSP